MDQRKPLFPALSLDDVRERLGDALPLDLSRQFQFSEEHEEQRVRDIRETVAPGMTFADFCDARLRAAAENPIQVAEEEYLRETEQVEPAQGGLDVLNWSAEYVLEMSSASFSEHALIQHFERFRDYVTQILSDLARPNRESLEQGEMLVFMIVSPVIKWHQHLQETSREAIVVLLEGAIGAISKALLSGNPDHDLLDAQNHLLYYYDVIIRRLEVGPHPNIIIRHLRILRSVRPSIWASVPARTRVQYAQVVLVCMCMHFDPSKPFATSMSFEYSTMLDFRNVLDDAIRSPDGAPFHDLDFLFKWFLDKLETDVFSGRHRIKRAPNLAALSEGEKAAVVELYRKFSTYRTSITVGHVEAFLLQFGTTTRIRAALRLLGHTRFYPLWELAESIQRLLGQCLEEEKGSQLVVAPLGSERGSKDIIEYLASHSPLGKEILFVTNVSAALAATRDSGTIHFIDDCLITATQTLNTLGDLTGTRQRKPHHTAHVATLDAAELSALQQRKLRFLFCVATDKGTERVRKEISAARLDPGMIDIRSGVVEPISAKAFDPMGPVPWASISEREELKEFAQAVGYDILAEAAAEKGWSDGRRKESALGYSDLQRLLVFPYNVPKSTVTLLWGRGGSMGWKPLFLGSD
ncbi:MAG: hypothetical protein QM778_18530 [Myxococcales bacterium]